MKPAPKRAVHKEPEARALYVLLFLCLLLLCALSVAIWRSVSLENRVHLIATEASGAATSIASQNEKLRIGCERGNVSRDVLHFLLKQQLDADPGSGVIKGKLLGLNIAPDAFPKKDARWLVSCDLAYPPPQPLEP